MKFQALCAGAPISTVVAKLGYTDPGASSPTMFSAGSWSVKMLLDDGTWRSETVQLVK